jgi:hypothetical protein
MQAIKFVVKYCYTICNTTPYFGCFGDIIHLRCSKLQLRRLRLSLTTTSMLPSINR